MAGFPFGDESHSVMDRRTFIGSVASGILALPLGVFAQQQGKVWRLGILDTVSTEMNAANLDAFRQGLRERGYVEGRNLFIEYRSADGRGERFADLATELVRLKVDLILTRGTPATVAAKNATQTIPVVMVAVGEPLMFVASLARPRGNVTGLSSAAGELEAKRFGLLRELVPGSTRIAALYNMSSPSHPPQWKEIEKAARSQGVKPQLLDVRKPEDLGPAFDAAIRERADGLVVGQDSLLQANRKLIAEL